MVAGIVAGALVVILAIAAAIFCRYRRRKNRQNRSVSIGPDGGWRWGIGPRPQSDMSFQCQSNILSPSFSPGYMAQAYSEKGAYKDEQGGSIGPTAINDLRKAQSPNLSSVNQNAIFPVPEESMYFDPPPRAMHGPSITSKSKASSKRQPTSFSAVPLHNLTTSLPAVPPNVHSPPSAVSRGSPLSASSARSTTALLSNHLPYSPSGSIGTEYSAFGSPGGYVPPPPPPKSPRMLGTTINPTLGRKTKGRRESGSPTDNKTIQTEFAPPPKR